MLTLENLTKIWPDGVIALDKISFSFCPGKLVAIIGPSGAGKTTLLRVIAGLDSYDRGKIENPYNRPGIVFQQSSLWPHLTLLENVSLALWVLQGKTKSEARKIAIDALKTWGLKDRLHAYPSELSGGQKQRGALARTIVLKPIILCLDEVTSALDPEITADILLRLKTLKQSDTIIILVTHRLGFAQKCADHIIFLEAGKVIKHGNINDIIENPKNDRIRAFVDAYKLS